MGKRQRKSKQRRMRPKSTNYLSTCPCCNKKGPHFIPPSFGDKGFFICESSIETLRCSVCGGIVTDGDGSHYVRERPL